MPDGMADEDTDVWDRIEATFAGSPSQRAVVELLLERGFAVDDDGKVASGGIAIPDTQVAEELDVDRRVVQSTTETILADDELREIFRNISSIPSLKDVAPVLGLNVVTVHVRDASESGVIAAITDVIAEHDVAIRQAVSDDPYFTDEPSFTVVVDGSVPEGLLTAIRDLPFVEGVDLA